MIRKYLIAIVLALTIFFGLCLLYQSFLKGSGELTFADFIKSALTAITVLVPSIVSTLGVIDKSRVRRSTQLRLVPSLKSGLYGGLVAGAASGLVIGLMYYFDSPDVGLQRIPLVFLYGSAAGTILGTSIQSGILWFSSRGRMRTSKLVFNELTGGTLGGAVGGVLTGAVAGVIFGSMSGSVVSSTLVIAVSCSVASVCIPLGILLYGYNGRLRNVVRSLVTSAIVTTLLIVFEILLFSYIDFARFFAGFRIGLIDVLEGGAILGATIGTTLGVAVGLALLLYRIQRNSNGSKRRRRENHGASILSK